ncbi:MAG: hypothetical protein ABSE73_09445 [Planctomycetota bacterium]
MRNAVLPLVLLLLLLTPALLASDGARGRHKRIYAVPCPGKVVIDGKLDDWDLSAQISMCVIQETAEMQSAKFALMYDKEALYLSGDVRDPSPLMNRHDPKVDGDKGWDADACQFRMILDPAQGFPVNQGSFNPVDNDQMAHLILWYYTDRKEPCLQLHLGMNYKVPRPEWAPHGVVPRDKFEAAYILAPDGRGYVFEYRIPWTTLGAKNPPKAGDFVAGTVQFNWSTPDGLKTAGGSAWAYDVMACPGFTFQSSACWGKIIFAEKGNVAKELVEEGLPPEKPLPLQFSFSLPEDGEATVQLFDDQGLLARTLVASGARRAGNNIERWDGLGDSGKLLAAGNYQCKGLYHQPIKTQFVLAVHNSGQPPYKTDDNTGGWGGDHGCATTVCAVENGMLLAWNACESGWGIVRTDLNGKKLWGSKHCATYLATDGKRFFAAGDHGFDAAPGVKVFDLADSRPLNFGNTSPQLLAPAGGDEKSNEVTGLAYGNGTVYVAYKVRDLVALFDSGQGTLKETWNVPAPQRLAVRRDGALLAISQGRVLAVSKGQAAPLVSEHLDQPSGIAVCPHDGWIYVANGGKLQNVSVFDDSGKYQMSIGKEGGRPRVGRFDKKGMLEPGGLAMDAKERLWVAETLDAPKRQSVWATWADEKAKQFVGGIVHGFNVPRAHAVGECVAEFFGGSSYFGWAYMDPKHPDEIYCHNVLWKVDLDKKTWTPHSTIWRATAPNMIEEANPGGYAGHFRVFTAKNGHQFGWGQGSYANKLYMRVGNIFKPIAGAIIVSKGNQFMSWPPYPIFADNAKFPNGTYLWQDANDDQTIQEDELCRPITERGEGMFNWIDEDLNAWCDAGFIFSPVRFEADGRPVYDFNKRTPIPFKGTNGNATSLWLDPSDGGVYTLNPGQAPGLAKYTRDGKLLWGYPRIQQWNEALNLPIIAPGRLWGLTMPLGIAGDFTGAADYYGPYHLFTRDGLYVAMIMRDGRTGGLGPDITASEVITGQLVKPEGMDRYFLLAGDQDGRVTEVLGLDTVKRLPAGTYVHSAQDAQRAAEALAEYERLKAKSRKLAIARGKASLAAATGVGKSVDAGRSFSACAAYDEQNLYVAYDVASPAELTNESTDSRLLFKGGNVLDIQLAADPQADPKRKTPAPGDVRILVTRQKGRPLAVIYRPKVRDFKGEAIVLASPTGKEAFDAIETAPSVALEYQKTGEGFKATAIIPLQLIGLTPRPGAKVRLDLGYIFGNATGSQAAVRCYWNNNSFSANVVSDVPNESRLEPAEWGEAAVE